MTHHNGSLQIFPEGERCHVVWIADILPDALAACRRHDAAGHGRDEKKAGGGCRPAA